jgi:chemotaxis regulatin CheY-phosphate phosphatase CheZ
MKTLKLKPLIEGYGHEEVEWSPGEKKKALDMISKFNEHRKALNRPHNLMEIAQTLSEIAKSAQKFTMNETDDWFDRNTVDRNMKELAKHSQEFQKLARENYVAEQRMEALAEDCGQILNRYFDIKDGIAESKLAESSMDSLAAGGTVESEKVE